jgi:SAM-dependent methyltransferase
MRVLEIGCGEAGVLKAFTDLGYKCTGIELEESRLEFAREFMKDELENGKIQFLNKDIYDVNPEVDLGTKFDLIILKDVIEHIPQQENFIPYLKTLLVPRGKVFFGFPPWYMPFGGHQQILISGWASKLPYYHLLPNFLYTGIMKMAGETKEKIDEMLEIKSTGINIERFEKIVNSSGFKIVSKQWFLINPIYKYKFGLNPKKQNWLFGAVPYLRNFLTTCAYYTIEME